MKKDLLKDMNVTKTGIGSNMVKRLLEIDMQNRIKKQKSLSKDKKKFVSNVRKSAES